jgi:hypothetical protein
MKIKRISEMSELEKAVIKMIWDDVKNIRQDGLWRTYEKPFIHENNNYKVKCSFKIEDGFLTHKNLLISRDTKEIQLPQGVNLH